MPIVIDRDTYYTFDEIASMFGIDANELRRASPAGRSIQVTSIGESPLVRGDHLLEYLDGFANDGAAAAPSKSPSKRGPGRASTRIHGIMRTGEFDDPLSPSADETPMPELERTVTPLPTTAMFAPKSRPEGPAVGVNPAVDPFHRSPSSPGTGSGEFRSFLQAGASSDFSKGVPTAAGADESANSPNPPSTRFNIDALVEEARKLERQRDDEDTNP